MWRNSRGGGKRMKFRANFWTNYVKFELLFIGTWSTKEFYPAWITGETMHVLWPAWNVISILTTPPLLPPSLLPFVRLDVSINEEEGVQLYGERKLEQKGPIKEWPKSKHRLIVDERWWEEGKVACKIYTKTIHFLRDSTSVNCNQRLRNELNKIQEEFSFPSRSIFKQRAKNIHFFLNGSFHRRLSIIWNLTVECNLLFKNVTIIAKMTCSCKQVKLYERRGKERSIVITNKRYSSVLTSKEIFITFSMGWCIQSHRRFRFIKSEREFGRNFSIFPPLSPPLLVNLFEWNKRTKRRTNFLPVIPNKQTTIKRTSKHAVYDQEGW